jgi:quercetin dioxygenase-like cupin family protein
MPIINASATHTHEAGPTRFWQLAAPSSGSTEASVWRVEVPVDTEPVVHELTREEILVVLSGTARASLNGVVDEVTAGGAIVVPAHTPFGLSAAGPDPVVALAFLPVGGQAKIGDQEPFTPPWAQ